MGPPACFYTLCVQWLVCMCVCGENNSWWLIQIMLNEIILIGSKDDDGFNDNNQGR